MLQGKLKITYKYDLWDKQHEIELPLKLLVIGNFTWRPDDIRLEDRKLIKIDKDNFNEVMAFHKISLTIRVKNYLSETKKNDLDVNLKFSSLSDFAPNSIVMQVPELIEFIKPFDGRKPTTEESSALSKQLDAIFHHPDFQKLEAAWMGLKFLVDRTDFRENIKIELLNVSKQDLFEDFEDEIDLYHSGLFKKVYIDEYEVLGGQPYGAIIASYDFGFGPQDIFLLEGIASVAALAHTPFIASASPEMFGLDDFRDLNRIRDIESYFEGPQYLKWREFRELQDSRYVGLTLPRFLLRSPYEDEIHPTKSLTYKEDISGNHEHYLWGNTAFALASRMTDSFAKYRWCGNITGTMGGGLVEGLPVHQYIEMGEIQIKPSTEVLIPGRREYELSEQGFISLCMRKDSDNAVFFSANSVQKPKQFESIDDTTDYKLGTQMPYLMFVCRFAHYLKVIHREKTGNGIERQDLEKELNNWIGRYLPNPHLYLNDRPYPFRKAEIVVKDSESEKYRYRFLLKVRPWFKYMGAYFNLGLGGILG